jgi:hypothetical protein
MNYLFRFRSTYHVRTLLALLILAALGDPPYAIAQQADADHQSHQTSLTQQIKELQAKVIQLEATVKQDVKTAANEPAPSSGTGGQGMGMMDDDMNDMGPMQPKQRMPAMGGMGMMDKAMKKMKSMQPARGGTGVDGMGRGASVSGVDAGMAARLDKMISMMETMVGTMDRTVQMMDRTVGMMEKMMESDSTPAGRTAPADAGAGMMDDDQMEMGGASMQSGQAPPPMGDM